MKTPCLICDGTRLGGIAIPPFELRYGELVCLHMPHLNDGTEEPRLIAALTGKRPVPGIRPLCRVLHAEPARHRRLGLFQLFRPMRITDWLQYTAGVPQREAESMLEEGRSILKDHDFAHDWQVCRLPGNPKVVLGLQAAWALGAEAVVFSLVGLDPWGREKIHEAVRARLDRCAAIELSYEFVSNGQPGRDCMPSARCLEVTRHSAGLASRQSA